MSGGDFGSDERLQDALARGAVSGATDSPSYKPVKVACSSPPNHKAAPYLTQKAAPVILLEPGLPGRAGRGHMKGLPSLTR